MANGVYYFQTQFLHQQIALSTTRDLFTTIDFKMTASPHSPSTYARTNQNKLPPLKKRVRLPSRSHFDDKRQERHLIRQVDKRTIRFCPVVSVVKIPNRLDYTESERENLWISEEDQARDKQRNIVEFAYEKGDWHQVVQENDFILVRGEWIHPVHVGNAFRRLKLRLALAETAKQL